MGFPRIIYGSGLDREVDFDVPAVLPSGPLTDSIIQSLPALSGVEKFTRWYDRKQIDLVFRNLSPEVAAQLFDFRDYQQQNPGTAFTVELDRDLGGYHSFHNTLDDNDSNAGTHTRASVAYALNPATGMFTSHATNTPRYVAGRNGKAAYFSEASRTNIITYPNDLSDASWAKSTATISANTSEVDDPEGTNTADKISITGTPAAGVGWTSSTAISTNSASFNCWLRTDGIDREVLIGIQSTSTGIIASNTVTITGQWQNFELNYVSSGSVAGNWEFIIVTNEGSGAIIYHYSSMGEVGAGIENASTIPDPTASGSTATRSADKLLIPATNLNREKGTIGMWVYPTFTYDEHPGTCLFHSGVDTSQRHTSLSVLGSGLWEYRVYLHNSSSSYIQLIPSASGLTKDTWHFVVITYDSTIANGIRLYLNGSLIGGPSVNDSFPASSVGTNMGVGNFNDGALPWFGAIQDFFYESRAWTATEVSRFYTMPSGYGLNRMSAYLRDFNFPITIQNGNRWSATIPCKEVIT